MEWSYHFEGEERVLSPALVYYEEILAENTRRAVLEAGGAKRLWPHIKTHKSPDLVRMLKNFGIERFKCATLAEAEMAANAGARHILLAYPLVGPNIGEYVKLTCRYPEQTFWALGDDLGQLAALGETGRKYGREIPFLVDVNTGMNRTGVPMDAVLEFYKKASRIPGISVKGLHCYDGERHEKEFSQRLRQTEKTAEWVWKSKQALTADGFSFETAVMGGSPSFPCYAGMMKEAYFSPGTIFVYDAGYREQFPDLPYVPGAAVMTRVISHPKEGYFTLDAGYKAISAEQGKRGCLVSCPHACEAFQSEEHWTFRMEPGYEKERPEIGTVLYVIPWHICPTTALYDEICVVAGGKQKAVWPVTARKRKGKRG